MKIARLAELRPEPPAPTIDARRWSASGPAGRRRVPALAASGLLHAMFALALVSLGVRAIAPRPDPYTLTVVFDPAPPAALATPPQPAPEPPVEPAPPVPPPEPPTPPAADAVPPTPEAAPPVAAPPALPRVPKLASPVRPASPVQKAPSRPPAAALDPKPRAEPAASAPLPAPASIDAGWRGALNAWLAAHKHYPEAARMRGIEGVVGVAFTAERDGRVLDVTITRSSGSAALDNSVRDMLAGQRVPAFPASMPQQASLSLAIRYTLEQ